MMQSKNIFGKCKALIVGDVMIDQYIFGHCDRISPEAPVPVLNHIDDEFRLGGAANVAANISSIGAVAEIIGVCGNDSSSKLLDNMLEDANIKKNLIKLSSSKTIQKVRFCSNNHQLLRLDYEDGFKSLEIKLLNEIYKDSIKDKTIVVLSDYNKGTLQNSEELIEIASKYKIPVLVDPKGTDFTKYKGAYLLTPNLKEFELIVGKCHRKKDIIENAKMLIEKLTLNSILVTQGSEGMTLVESDGKFYSIPAITNDVVDVTGAGDTVVSVLAASLGAGVSIKESAELANTAAASVVKQFGTSRIKVSDFVFK